MNEVRKKTPEVDEDKRLERGNEKEANVSEQVGGRQTDRQSDRQTDRQTDRDRDRDRGRLGRSSIFSAYFELRSGAKKLENLIQFNAEAIT